MSAATTLLTVGHSTRTLEAFLDVVRVAEVGTLFDVRRWPASRRHPHFGGEPLSAALDAVGIAYIHEPAMGGYRKPLPASANTAWKVTTFRGYADHVVTDEFQRALDRVLAACEHDAARGLNATVMCAELAPEQCHRRLIADAATARGARVIHVLDTQRTREHVPPPFARIADGLVTYPGEPELPLG